MSKQILNINSFTQAGQLAKGTIQVPLNTFRLISSNDIPNSNTTDGGIISKNTAPIFERVNAATDKATRLSWASASVIEIASPTIVYPNDIDVAAPMVINILAAMKAGSVDVPTLTVNAFVGVGDSNCGGTTAALSTTLAQVTVSIAAADLGTAPNFLNFTIAPGTHATASNDVYVYGVSITYTRKA